MTPIVDTEVDSLLCCSHCKSELEREEEVGLRCCACGTFFPRVTLREFGGPRGTVDFRPHWRERFDPAYKEWQSSQSAYERKDPVKRSHRSYEEHLARIARERPVYEQFKFEGRFLDVGGHRGRVREHLSEEVTLYVSLDPYADVFSNIENEPDYVRAYPAVKEPLNFVLGGAEHLPIRSGTFDWVHMRSCVDHFENPLVAFKEAHRVLRPGGRLFVAVGLRKGGDAERRGAYRAEGMLRRLRRVATTRGWRGVTRAALARLPWKSHDHHLWQPDYPALEAMLAEAGFAVEEVCWLEKEGQWVNLSAAPRAKRVVFGGQAGAESSPVPAGR